MSVLRDGAGDKHKLLLAAGNLRVRAPGQVANAHALQRCVRALHMLLARRADNSQVMPGAHDDHIKHAVVVHGRVRLRNIGDFLRTLTDVQLAQVLPIHQNAARISAVQTQNALEQRGLSHAVGTQHVHQRSIGNLQIQVKQHWMVAV